MHLPIFQGQDQQTRLNIPKRPATHIPWTLPLPPPPQLPRLLHSLILFLPNPPLSLKQARQAHALFTVSGLHRLISAAARLITIYSLCNDLHSSSLLFFNHPTKNTFLFNTIIRAHTNGNQPTQAFSLYNEAIRRGLKPDDHTFPFLLKACADSFSLQKGREIHGSITKLGFNSDVYVGNTLLAFYSSLGNVREALQVFDEMTLKDIVSWNTIIRGYAQNGHGHEALQMFSELQGTSLRPNEVTVVSVLPVCALLEDLQMGIKIHEFVMGSGLDSQLNVCNALVDMYAKCGDTVAAYNLLGSNAERNVITWNSIISGFAQTGLAIEALQMFREMILDGQKPNSITVTSLLPSLAQLRFLPLAKESHAFSLRIGAETDIFVVNSLIDMYAKLGFPEEARILFDGLVVRNLVSWNAIVANCAQNSLEVEAMSLVREMQANGECPNSVTLTNVLPACSRWASIKHGKEIHGKAIRSGYSSDIFVFNAVMDMYVKCGYIGLARLVFDKSERDLVSFNILIMGYSQSFHALEALQLFSEMELEAGLKHDTVSFMGALSACANLSAIKQGREIHGCAIRKFFVSHIFVANSLLDMYTKSGCMEMAKRLFDRIPDKDLATWNTMILGYGMQGEFEVAVDLFDQMGVEGMEYDSVSFVAVLSACSHGGMVDRGREYFNLLQSFNIRPTQMHCACMVDLLGRAGLMQEAVEFIKGISFEPDANVWGALLGASRVHGDVEMGELAAKHLFQLKPEHSGYYILLSNMYAELGRWDDAKRVRKLMRSRGVKKDPGCSWIEVGNRLHAFLVGQDAGEEERLMGSGLLEYG
ncbi:hypothetical protein AMTRI_Chr10g6140 [Amborella trichopoda]